MPDWNMLMGPLAGLGFGGLAGAVVGYAAKKLTKMVAILLGVLFITIQVLAYYQLIVVDWVAVQSTAEQAVHSEQGRSAAQQAWSLLTANLPWGGGFVAGFAIGFKLG
jgi:uncharacterized membrane protein (Fun14 family)